MLLSSVAHKQWLWKADAFGEKHSSLATLPAALHILSYSSSHLNIHGHRFCFKTSMDPTATISITMGNLRGGWGHKFRIGFLKFPFLPFPSLFSERHSQYSRSFHFLIVPVSLNLFIVKIPNLGNQDTTNGYTGELQLYESNGTENPSLFFLCF